MHRITSKESAPAKQDRAKSLPPREGCAGRARGRLAPLFKADVAALVRSLRPLFTEAVPEEGTLWLCRQPPLGLHSASIPPVGCEVRLAYLVRRSGLYKSASDSGFPGNNKDGLYSGVACFAGASRGDLTFNQGVDGSIPSGLTKIPSV